MARPESWSVQDAKARFSEFLETCLSEGPQIVTKRGTETAVLVSAQEWRRLQAAAQPGLKALLLSDAGRTDLPVTSEATGPNGPPPDAIGH